MKRTLFIVAALVAFATAASAATLSVVSDKATYNIGETITLSVSGDAQGATTYGIFGRLEMSGALVDALTTTQKIMKAATGWTKGTLEINNVGPTATVEAFDQITNPADGMNAVNPIATITLIAQAFGLVNVTWNQDTGSGFELGFFGITSSPGTSFTIVPEPTTMALLGLGLVGLAMAGRRRS
jgi:hypothetical protein